MVVENKLFYKMLFQNNSGASLNYNILKFELTSHCWSNKKRGPLNHLFTVLPFEFDVILYPNIYQATLTPTPPTSSTSTVAGRFIWPSVNELHVPSRYEIHYLCWRSVAFQLVLCIRVQIGSRSTEKCLEDKNSIFRPVHKVWVVIGTREVLLLT